MLYLIAGLVIFLGAQSIRIFAEPARSRLQETMGANAYKGAYSVVSALGLGLIVVGFAMARETPTMLWMPPVGMRHAASLLNVLAFILLAAAYVPRNFIKARWHHPMVLGVKVWALAHLLANGSVAHVVLFGSFLAWGVADFVAARKRDRAMGTVYPSGTIGATAATVVIGAAAWAVFAFWLHGWLIGINPIG